VIYATTTNSLFSQPSHPSSVGPNGQTYNSYDAKSSSVYGNYPAPSVDFKSYDSYEDSKKTISTPCPTPAWSSQSGHIPLTKTHTTITVQTVTKCSYDKKDCPVNSATPTVLVTETKTAITVVAVPTTTVYVTSIVDVCSTGLQTKTVTVTQTCNKGCISKPTGIPQGYTTTVKYCEACATPSTVTVTFCTACAGTPARPTPPVQVLSVPTASTVSDYNSQAKATPSTFSGYSKPAVGIYSVPSKPSMPSGNNATVVNSVPGSQTPAKTMTLQTSVASTGAYRCSGSACGGVPTSYTPAQFTGAAVHEKANFPFIAPMILAGFAFLM
jgi:chitinase